MEYKKSERANNYFLRNFVSSRIWRYQTKLLLKFGKHNVTRIFGQAIIREVL